MLKNAYDDKTLQCLFLLFQFFVFSSQKMKQISMIGLRWWISYILLKLSVIEKSKYTKISSVSFIEKKNKTKQNFAGLFCVAISLMPNYSEK